MKSDYKLQPIGWLKGKLTNSQQWESGQIWVIYCYVLNRIWINFQTKIVKGYVTLINDHELVWPCLNKSSYKS